MDAEVALFAGAVGLGAAVLLRFGPWGKRIRWGLALGLAYWALVSAALWQPNATAGQARALPARTARGGYVSSDACRSCHPDQYASWHRSFHRSMTEAAIPQNVRAPFNQRLELSGHVVELELRGQEFWAKLPDLEVAQARAERGLDPWRADLPRVERRVVMTTGSHHYQAYWLQGRPGQGLKQLPFVYLLAERRWIPRRAAFLQPPEEEYFARWNSNCIQCHAVAGRPGRDPSIGDFDTQVAELGIACEACHGPAEAHVERHRNPVTRFAQHLSQALDPTIVNPKRLDAAHGSMICGQCHAYFVPLQESEWWKNGFAALYRAGQGLDGSRHMLDYFSDRETPAPNEAPLSGPPILSTSFESVFWPDGTIRVGGREYNGLLLSPCFQRGQGRRKLDCLSCHSMHQSQPDDQLASRMEGNRACVQCHTEFSTRLSRHTHHQTESSGSLCYNCHMPYTTYALFKGIRSHRIDSPRASSVSERDRPNACNLCHLDRTLGWARRYLMDWYRQPSREPDDPEAVVEPEADTVAASVLWLLRGDAATRVVVAQSYGWSSAQRASGRDWQAPLLAELLVDPYSAVRWVAHQSLSTLPGFEGFEYDFIAPNDDLHKARELALHRSSELGRSKASKELLQNARGELDRSAVRRLLSERDDRPVTIAE